MADSESCDLPAANPAATPPGSDSRDGASASPIAILGAITSASLGAASLIGGIVVRVQRESLSDHCSDCCTQLEWSLVATIGGCEGGMLVRGGWEAAKIQDLTV